MLLMPVEYGYDYGAAVMLLVPVSVGWQSASQSAQARVPKTGQKEMKMAMKKDSAVKKKKEDKKRIEELKN